MNFTLTLRFKKLVKSYQAYADFYSKGKRIPIVLGHVSKDYTDKNTKVLAVDKPKLKKIQLEFAKLQLKYENEQNNGVNPADFDLIADLEKAVAKNKRCNESNVLAHIKKFTKRLHGVKYSDIDIKDFSDYLYGTVGNNTHRQYLNILKSFYKAIDYEKPFKNLKMPRASEPDITGLSDEKIVMLYNTDLGSDMYPDVKPAFLFSCYTGLRLSDVSKLRFSNIIDGKVVFKNQKSKKTQSNALPESALQILSEMKDTKDGLIFNIPTNRSSISLILNRWAKKAFMIRELVTNNEPPNLDYDWQFEKELTIDNITYKQWAREQEEETKIKFHLSRHTFASLLYKNGGDVLGCRAALGHKNINTSLRYLKVNDVSINSKLNSIPNILKSK